MSSPAAPSARAWALLLALALIWGASFLTNRLALDEVPVLTTVALRVSGAAVLLWVWVLVRGLPLPRNPRILLSFGVMGLLNNAVPFTLIVWGQSHISSGLAAILNASTAIFGILVAALVFSDERLSFNRLIGVIFGFAGVTVAIGLDSLANLDLRSLAQLAILGSSLSYALAGAFGRVALRGLVPEVAAAGMLSAAALVMLPLALLHDGWPTFAYSATGWAALLYLSVVATAVAYLLYYRVLTLAGSGNLLLVTLMVAPVAIALGALILGETLRPAAFLGFALLACGLIIIDGRVAARFRRRGHIKESA